MTVNKKADIIVGAKDEASKKLKGIAGSLSGIGGAAIAVNQGLELARKATDAFVRAYDLARVGAETEKMEFAFERMSESVGGNADEIIAKVKDLTNNTVSEFNIMRNASRLAALGLPIDKIGEFAEIARAAAAAMGESTQFMFDSIVTGTARQSRLILDNLGIIISETKVYAEATAAMGRELTDAEKKQAFLNAVIVEGKKNIDAIGDTSMLAMDSFEQFEAQMDDFNRSLGKIGIVIVTNVLPFLIEMTERWIEFFEIVGLISEPIKVTAQNLTIQTDALKRLDEERQISIDKLALWNDLSERGVISGRVHVVNTRGLQKGIKALDKEIGSITGSINRMALAQRESIIEMFNMAQASADTGDFIIENVELVEESFKKTMADIVLINSKSTKSMGIDWDDLLSDVIRAEQLAENFVTNSFANLTDSMVEMMFGARIKLQDVFKGIAKDFLKLFIQEVTRELAAAVASWIVKLLLFDVRANDLLVMQSGRDYAKWFIAGVDDQLNTVGLVSSLNRGALSSIATTAPVASGFSGGGVNITIQGNIIGEDDWVKNRMVPILEEAIFNKETNIDVELI